MVSATARMSTSSEFPASYLSSAPEIDTPFVRRVAFKSPATISQEQSTAKYDGESGVLATRGRHDPCVVPRSVLTLARLYSSCSPFSHTAPSPLSRPWPLLSSWSTFGTFRLHGLKLTLFPLRSAVLIQNSRRAAAASLPPLATPLPPSMSLPTKQQYQKAVDELVKE